MKLAKCGLAYESSGPSDTDLGIVFVHGWACRHSDYDGVVEQLVNETKSDYRIITIDLPGHGQTSKEILPEPSMTGFADLVLTLCRELGLKTIVVAGHSMGVRVAAETWKRSLGATTGPTVAGIVFIDGSHYKLRPSLFAFDNGDPRSASMSEEKKTALKAEAFRKMFSSSTPQAFKEATTAHVAQMDQAYSHAVRDSMIGYDREQMEGTIARLGKEGAPLLNIQSSDIGPDNQRVAMREGGRSKWMVFLEETVPQVRHVIVTDSAHFPHVDRPDVIAKAVDGFVKDVRGREK